MSVDEETRGDRASMLDNGFPPAPQISLPKGGGAIRGIGEKYSVSPATGTGAMLIPIAAPPGRDGFGPRLSLSHDSGAGDGVFGLNWNVDLPAIRRKTDKGLPRYFDPKEFDVFVLSGSEDLVPVFATKSDGSWDLDDQGRFQFADESRDGYLVRPYRPRIEGLFARIERWTRLNDGDTHWRSISKDNVLTVYGRTENSRIANPAYASQVFSWLICESYDAKGNAIIYAYKPEDASDVALTRANERNRVRTANRYPQSIRYGNQQPILIDTSLASGRASHIPAPDLSNAGWMFEVVFDYGESSYHEEEADEAGRIFATVQLGAPPGSVWPPRLDPFSSYRSGFEVRCYRLCRRVLVFHHFPAELGVADYLVSATELSYSEQPGGSLVSEVLQSGYCRQPDGTYLKRSFPPLSFTYSVSPLEDGSYDGLRWQGADAEGLRNLPAGIDTELYRWVDLDGEGIAGVLTEQADGWLYKPNLGDGALGAAHTVARRPSATGLRAGRQQLLDLAGDGALDLVDLTGPAPGFFSRTEAACWDVFRPFRQLPNLDWRDPNLRFVDLTGDGLTDLLLTSDPSYRTWHASLGETGFAAADRVFAPPSEEQGPRLVIADETQTIFLADMCADNLSSLVRIRQGEVCYWPNTGYGTFGAKVTLDNAPVFDDLEAFDPRRIRLSDTDGSGCADIIYLGRDGIRIYLNRRGSSLSDARVIADVPRIDDLSTVMVTDFLGRGTACLVWSSPLPAETGQSVRYLDLMNGVKPNLLTGVANNLGAQTTIRYTTSTQFYLADKAAGTPWVTRLPFPVHVVAQVESRDLISGNLFTANYAYHHGYFDGVEREFRGFGRVDQWDTQEFAVLEPQAQAAAGANLDPAFYAPPALTKTWFHTGAYVDGRRISHQFQHEYFREGDPASGQSSLSDAEFQAMLLVDTVLPADLADDEVREAVRALKGSMLRQETYGLDDSEAADRPYSVSERNYGVTAVQPRGRNRHLVFFSQPRETIDFHYERGLYPVLNGQIVDAATPAARRLADPRVSHTLALRTDAYGNVEQSLAIAYGRRFDDPDPALTAGDRATQKRVLVTLTDAAFTNAIADIAAFPDAHHTPLAAATRTYELVNFAAAYQAAQPAFAPQGDITNLVRFEAAQQLLSGPADGAVDIPHEDINAAQAPAGVLCRRLIDHAQTRYRSDDLAQLLPAQQLEPLALPGEAYKLAFTTGLLVANFLRGQPGQAPENLLPDAPSVLAIDATHEADRGGYVHLDGDADWWIPSGRTYYHHEELATAAAELTEAAAHFFMPRRMSNPFGDSGYVDYIKDLLPIQTRDPVGNSVQATHDYRVLQPNRLTDANGNQSFVAFDTLGLAVAIAVCGKDGEGIGDSLADMGPFDADPSLKQLQSFVADPTGQAADLLKSATMRFVYDVERYRRCAEPPLAATLARETHVSDPGGAEPQIQVGFTYSDGWGREIQTKSQAEPGLAPSRAANAKLPSGDVVLGVLSRDGNGDLIQAAAAQRWVGKGRTVFNNKGHPVKQYEPFFSATHLFEPEPEMTDTGVTPVLFYDPMARLVATLHPNHCYEKLVFDPWREARWDLNDTVMLNPKLDPDVAGFFSGIPDAAYLPTWYQQRTGAGVDVIDQAAATKASKHAATPAVSHFDSLGRAFLAIADNGRDGAGKPQAFRTLTALDIEGNARAVFDALGRLVMRYDYDMLGHRIHQASMEAGERWTLADVTGKPIRAWDGRGHNFSTEYDALRRPVHQFVRGTTAASDPRTLGQDVLFEKIEYGENQPNDVALNLRTRIFRHSDTAGVVTSQGTNPNTKLAEAYDFKGNALRTARRLVGDYKALADWSNPPPLDAATYTGAARYDALNRPTQLIAPHSDQPDVLFNVTQHVFNAANLLGQIQVWLAQPSEPAALVVPATDKPSPVGVTNIDYDAKGQRTAVKYANDVQTSYAYDPLTFRLTQLITKRPTAKFPDDCPQAPQSGWPGCQVQNLHYTYDPVGNITHIKDAAQQTIYFKNKRVEPSADYDYDPLYRLIRATGREQLAAAAPVPHSYNDAPRVGLPHPGDGNAVGAYSETYSYDAVGNFIAMSHARTDAAAPGWTRAYAYGEDSQLEAAPVKSNRLTSTTIGTGSAEIYSAGGDGYDAHGNMLRLPQLQVMQWDFKDRLLITQRQKINADDIDGGLRQGERTYYVYDTAGERVRKVTERATGDPKEDRTYLGGFEVYHKQGLNGLVRETLHVMDGQRRIALVETRTSRFLDARGGGKAPAQLIRYQFGNHLGSAVLELDDQSQIISYEEYSPYGSSTYQAVANAVDAPKIYRFSDKERDEGTGLNYHGARYYSAWLGNWVSCDPLGIKFSCNPFEYVLRRPVTSTDLTGMAPTPAEIAEKSASVKLVDKYSHIGPVVNVTPINKKINSRGVDTHLVVGKGKGVVNIINDAKHSNETGASRIFSGKEKSGIISSFENAEKNQYGQLVRNLRAARTSGELDPETAYHAIEGAKNQQILHEIVLSGANTGVSPAIRNRYQTSVTLADTFPEAARLREGMDLKSALRSNRLANSGLKTMAVAGVALGLMLAGSQAWASVRERKYSDAARTIGVAAIGLTPQAPIADIASRATSDPSIGSEAFESGQLIKHLFKNDRVGDKVGGFVFAINVLALAAYGVVTDTASKIFYINKAY